MGGGGRRIISQLFGGGFNWGDFFLFGGGGGKPFSDIEFTMEVNNDLTLFLDVLIKRDTLGFNTQRVSVKKNFPGAYSNWKSLARRTYKIGLINCLF